MANSGVDVTLEIDQKQLQRYLQGEDMVRGLQTLGQMGETKAKALAPVRTGNLRRSITHEVGKDGRGAYVRVGTNVRYAGFQELGTRHHPAQPFLRPMLHELEAML